MELIKKCKRYVATILAMVLCFSVVQLSGVTVFAAEENPSFNIASGSLTLTSSEEKNYYNGNEYTGSITITGTTKVYSVSVESGTHNVIMQGASITSRFYSAFDISSGATVNMTLEGENSVTSGIDSAGIQVPEGATLTITKDSTGSLSAIGAAYGAGIGGGNCYSAGTINIEGGSINPQSLYGAGIGGGYKDAAGNINISGGTINSVATSSAAIGVGGDGSGGTVTITGGNIYAYGGVGGSGCTVKNGSGEAVVFTTIVLNELNAERAISEVVGASYNANGMKTINLSGEEKVYMYLPNNSTVTAIKLSDGSSYVGTATAGNLAVFHIKPDVESNPSIALSSLTGTLKLKEESGTKYYSTDGTDYSKYAGNITITGTTDTNTVLVESGEHDVTMSGASITNSSVSPIAISSGAIVNLTLKDTNVVTTTAENLAGVQVPENATLNIKESTGSLKTTAQYGAGIGGNEEQKVGTINIDGGTITATSALNAGIGGGGGGAGGTINISGGVITATGGSGAGIGGGASGAGGTIEITGGIITAKSQIYGAGIGGGFNGAGGTIKISGGTIIATGGSYPNGSGAGIGGGYKGAGGTIVISGGNVKATGGTGHNTGADADAIGNGADCNDAFSLTDGTNTVALATITLNGLTTQQAIKSVGVSNVVNYGTNDMTTLDTNMLYVYITKTEAVTAKATSVTLNDDSQYVGSVEAGKSGKLLLYKNVVVKYSPVLDGTVGMNLYATLKNAVKNNTSAYVQFSFDGEKTKVYVKDATNETITVDDVAYDCYVFPCKLSPKQMAEDVVATLYTGSETENLGTYNLKSASADSDKTALFEAMKNYGAYAQNYFAYDAENPVVPTTDVSGVTIVANDVQLVENAITNIEYVGSSLVLNDEMKIHVYFNTVGAIDEAGLSSESGAIVKVADDLYYVEVAVTGAMDTNYAIAVNYNDTTQFTVTTSPLSCAKKITENSNSNDSKNLMKALYNVFVELNK